MNARPEHRDFSPWQPGRLWSLWDIMHAHSAHDVFLLAQMLATLTNIIGGRKPDDRFDKNADVTGHVGVIASSCQNSGLVVSAVLANRLSGFIAMLDPPIQNRQFLEQLMSIRNSIEAECSTLTFFRLTPDESKYYLEKQPFGEQVAEKFPAALQDIEEASKSLALSRS